MFPTRPAPPPPPKSDDMNGIVRRSTTVAAGINKIQSDKSSRSDKYTYLSVPRSRSTSDISSHGKKLPPPRPPPPKLPSVSNSQQRPQNIKIKLPGFKSRKKSSRIKPRQVHVSSWHATPTENKSHPLVGSLIDLQSPPLSPSFTTNRYSSDDTSIDSFDSDSGGPSSNENHNGYSAGWSSSQVESGFEDDFDRLSTPSSTDPWSDTKPDGFLSSRKKNLTSQFELSNDDPKAKKLVNIHIPSPNHFKPTIIRPALLNGKPIKPPPPLILDSSSSSCGSPPMPSVPPPPPPPEVLEVLAHGPPIPPRPMEPFKLENRRQQPYCIALYDYEGDHGEDLSFKTNDRIHLKRNVNEEWLEGSVDGKMGIFPACFVNIVVPLPTDNVDSNCEMIALYDFQPLTWDDLQLKEGDSIRVIGRVNNDWLYGECNGKQGQFPSSYAAEYSLS